MLFLTTEIRVKRRHMEPEILAQANAIVLAARDKTRQTDLESTVQDFEQSGVRSLESLARVYRMFQRPPQ
jgi:hypothetical protein